MKVKELINALMISDPESDLHFEFGGDDEYRLACARLIAEQPLDVDYREDKTPMYANLELARIDIGINCKEINFTFEQGYLVDSVIDGEIAKIAEQRRELKKERMENNGNY